MGRFQQWLISGILLVCLGLIGIPVNAQSAEELFSVTCQDEQQLIGHRLTLPNLGRGETLRFTLLGVRDFSARMGVVEAGGRAECSQLTPELLGSAVAAPSVGRVQGRVMASRAEYTPTSSGSIDVIVGGAAGISGQWALVIDNLSLNRANEVDSMQVAVPPSTRGEWLGVFMMSGTEDSSVDPFMVMTAGTEDNTIRLACDNAGTGTCPHSTTLFERGVQFADEDEITYVGGILDAGAMGVFPYSKLVYEFSAMGGDTGSYVLILTGTAPGDINDSRLICDNVLARVQDASPEYNSLYPAQNMLDNNPDTRYVTGAPLPDAAAPPPVPTYVVLEFDQVEIVDRIRIGGYIPAPELQPNPNAVQTLSVTFLGRDSNTLVTALKAQLRPLPTYQTFSFVPAETREIGLLLETNFGGTLFEIADVQVCAVR